MSGGGVGVGVGAGGLGIGAGVGSGHSRTHEAERLAPPKSEPWGCLLGFIIFIVSFFVLAGIVTNIRIGGWGVREDVGITIAFWGALLVAIVGGFMIGRRNRAGHLSRLQIWDRTWVCRRCGHTADVSRF